MPRNRRIFMRGLEIPALAMAGLAALAMTGMVAVIVASVLLRRFSSTPLHITEELVGLMLSASLFLGLPLVTLRAQHVRVSIVADALGHRFAPLVRIAALVVGLVFFGWIIRESIPWFDFAFRRTLRTETVRLLLYPWMAVLPLSLALTWLIFLARLLGLIEPEHPTSLEELPELTPAHKDD